MFRNKNDVDRHVTEIMRKVKSEREKNLKCYNIALQYYKIREYEAAKLYLSMYLLAKEDAPPANKLLGQIYEALGKKEKAISAYKTSLEYESNQPDLVLKICELMCEPEVSLDVDRARYWCDRGSDLFPHDPAIFRLREKILKMGGNANSQDFEQLINAEKNARPTDVNVRIRLLKLYLETDRVKIAYNEAMELECKQTFRNELSWYECVSQVCEAYREQNKKDVDWQFYMHWVSVLNKVTRLSLMEGHGTNIKGFAHSVQAVFNLDQTLYKAIRCSTAKESSTVVELYKEFLKHMSAELYLHTGTLIWKKAKNDHSNWKEATQNVAPLMFLAMYRPPDMEGIWALSLKPNLKKSLQVFRDDACYRVSQAGYILLGLAKEDTANQFVDKVTQKLSNNWRERLFQRVFSTQEHRKAIGSSCLVQDPLDEKVIVKLSPPPVKNPDLVPVYERIHTQSLHYLSWLGVEILRHNSNKLPQDFHTYGFTSLHPSGNKLAVESLNRLDMDAFLYLTVFCASAALDEEVLSSYYPTDRPVTLPADISNMMCTVEQAKWWSLACSVYNQNFKKNSNFVEVRNNLQQGIEVLRIVGNHGLDVQVIVKLARTFAERANQNQLERALQDALDARANMYWSAAVPLLEKIQRNQPISAPAKCLFKYPKKELTAAEIASLLEEGRYYVACRLMKEKEYERAIEAFKILRSPHASFNQALIYKKLAEAELLRNPEDITSEIRSKHIILLTKARDCLYTTKERVRLDKRNSLHSSLADVMEEVESALVRIEPDFVHRKDDGILSDASMSSVGSPVGEVPISLNTPRLNGRLLRTPSTSTPQKAQGRGDFHRQSNQPEYVEVGQLLQIQTLVEQNKKILDKIDNLTESLSLLTTRVDNLSEDVKKFKPAGPEDLYAFGEEEDYGEDVLGQYASTFPTPYQPPPTAAAHYYTPRGVQGTSTLTYGAPPVTPTVPQFYPTRLEATLNYQSPVVTPLTGPPLNFYNQSSLPFSEGQQLPDFMRAPVLPKQPVPPVNVVITTSDTLPTGPPPVQPPMSVTIPPQHRLGTIPTAMPVPVTPPVHNFQISMPATANIISVEKSPNLAPQEEFESDDETNVVEHDPCPDFQPIIPLPDEVAVHTGEEGEIVLFENRAKLYRHVDKEWKERGVGTLKILKNKANGIIRILMRRDQVLKICANHLLKSDMELTPLKNSNNAYIWVANDFADEQVQLEKLCAKFKTPEEALKFKDAFNEAKKSCGTSPIKPKRDLEKDKKDSEIEKKDNEKSSDKGKVSFGGFTFSSTPMVKQDKLNKKVEEKKKDSQTSPSPFASFSFSSQKTTQPSSTITTVEKPKTGGLLRQPLLPTPSTPVAPEVNKVQPKSILKDPVQFETPKSQPFVFTPGEKSQPKHVLFQDSKSEPPKSESNSPSLRDLLVSGSATEIIDFAALSKMNENKPAFTGNTGSKFEGAGSTVFGRQKQSSESEPVEDFEPTADFKPVVPLPDLVEVKTGEEGQIVLFEERAKLYRFDSTNKEWKERGVGNMKILKDPKSGGARFLMRREQVLKLCCNHWIPSNLEVKSHLNSDRAWTWHAQDYAEGEMRNELFVIRFKNPDQAHKFKSVLDKVLQDLKNMPVQPPLTASKTPEPSPITSPSSATSAVAATPPSNVWKCSCLFPNSTETSSCRACKKPKPHEAASPKLSEWARPKRSVWECSTCYTVNEPKDFECVTCGSEKKTSKSPQAVPLSQLSSLKPKEGSWNCLDCYLVNEIDVNECSACGGKRPAQEQTKTPLSELFKAKPGSWNCSVCYVTSDASVKTCPACLTTKPGEEKTEDLAKPLSDVYKPKPGTWNCKECYVPNDATDEICVACKSPKPGGKSTQVVKKSNEKVNMWNCSKCSTSNDNSAVACSKCKSEKPKSLAELFKPKTGSWECNGCLVRNEADKNICPACNTPKPGYQPPQEDTKSSFSSSGFTFGMPTNDVSKMGFNFGKPNTKIFGSESTSVSTGFSFGSLAEKGSSFTFGASNENKKEEKPFTFGVSPDKQSGFGVASSDKDSNKTSSFSFGLNSGSGSLFGGLSGQKQNATTFQFGASPTNDQIKKETDGSSFGTPGKFEFNFGGVRAPKSPAEQAAESDDEEVEEDNGDHIHFQPVIPLPDKVDVKTGEENEEVLYSHRAKLYRYTEGEWKERGLGDIKILKNVETKRIRLLMRREPIMKLCLNHFLTPELSFSEKDNRAWLWTAMDYAEEQLKAEQFCLRFKNSEIALAFKAAIDAAQNELNNKSDGASGTDKPGKKEEAKTEDLEIVYENEVTPEEREAALKLLLPPKFYAYRRAPPCPGCVGCEPDDGNEAVSKESVKSPAKIMYEVCTDSTPPISDAQVIVVSTDDAANNSKPTNLFTSVKTMDKATALIGDPYVTSTSPSVFTPPASSWVGSGKEEKENETPKNVLNTAGSQFAIARSETPLKSNESLKSVSNVTQSPLSQSLLGESPSPSNITPSQSPKPQSIFGSASSKPQTIFGGTPTEITNNQSTVSNTPSEGLKTYSVFGNSPSAGSTTPTLFGGLPNNDASKSGFTFTLPPSEGTNTSFGQPVDPSSQTPKTQFKFSLTPGKPVFGGTPDTSKSTPFFGSSNFNTSSSGTPDVANTTPKSTSFFGSASFNAGNSGTPDLTNATPKSTSFFGSASFNASNSGSIFGGSSTFGNPTPVSEAPSFSFTKAFESTKNDNANPQSNVGSSGGMLSGASLNSVESPFIAKADTSFAQVASANKPIGFSKVKENFSWAGVGTPLFSSNSSTANNSATEKNDSSGDEGEEDQAHDPHFEPIVPLPAVIQVRTGEEDEIKEFCERAKLYRFNNNTKEWKERGVGEMKILRHPVNNTYRLLMRREQVHKVVCNHLLSEAIEMKPMTNSETSVNWAAMNLSDENDTPQTELLAVKFKNVELLKQFKAKVDECVRKVIELKQVASSADPLAECGEAEGVEGEEDEDDEYNDSYDEDEDDDDDVYELLFHSPVTLLTRREDKGKWATIGSGDLQVVYDRDILASRILMKDSTNTLLFDSVIAGDSQLTVEGKVCIWIAEEGAQVMARFHTDASAEEFKMHFYEGVDFAEKALI